MHVGFKLYIKCPPWVIDPLINLKNGHDVNSTHGLWKYVGKNAIIPNGEVTMPNDNEKVRKAFVKLSHMFNLHTSNIVLM
jgi:hypothetical protein